MLNMYLRFRLKFESKTLLNHVHRCHQATPLFNGLFNADRSVLPSEAIIPNSEWSYVIALGQYSNSAERMEMLN